VRGFFNHTSITRGAPHLHRDTHDYTPAPPASMGLK
jgi:hypothetical protein